MTSSPANTLFDKTLVRARLVRALANADFPDFLHWQVAGQMMLRLDQITRQFEQTLVLTPGTIAPWQALAGRGQLGRVIIASPVAAGTGGGRAGLVCDPEALPIAPEALDCIIAPLGLEGINDLTGTLIQLRRALKPDGLFLAAVFGGDTLGGLRHGWLTAEEQVTGGATPRVVPFGHIRDLGNLLQRAGFGLPVADADRLQVRYGDGLSLMREVKAMGLSNALEQRSRTPVTRSLLAAACAACEALSGDRDGRLSAIFEIVYLTAWAPDASQPQPLAPGSARARLADALSTRERKA